jgi:SAM-dependent methyltransferase
MNETVDREQAEILFWRDDPVECPGSERVENIINKMGEARNFLRKIKEFREQFSAAGRILELGSGQGWAGCIVKKEFPDASVFVSDISPWAVSSHELWERVFQVRLNGVFACRGNALPVAEHSIDLVYCFAAAHHFADHPATLREISRILTPNGRCLYLYEPACRRYIYSPAKRRVNRKRPQVPEDVLVWPELIEAAKAAGLRPSFSFDTSTVNRGSIEQLYYRCLTRVPLLRSLLPCTTDFLFEAE